MRKIRMSIDDSIAGGAYANGSWDTSVKVFLKDGRELKERVLYSRGEAQNPLSEEVLEKVRQCMSVTLDPQKIGPAVEMLRDLKQHSVRQIMNAIESAV